MQANEINIDEIYYLLDEEARTAKVIANPYLYEGDIDIPSHINHLGETYCVTSIGKDAFNGCSSLTSIKISENIVDIGEYIRNNPHPQYNKYLDPRKFKRFAIENGNIVWGKNWDLMFPIEQLYSGEIL